MEARAVILAAGESKRMGEQKLLMPFRGRPMIDWVIDAAQEWHPVVVAGTQVVTTLRDAPVSLVENAAPERGMAHSLALANANVPKDAALIVLLGDKPLVTHALIHLVCERLGDADVAYPVHRDTLQPGHPVVFSARARQHIDALPEGDTLQLLRDDPSLAHVRILTEDEGAYFDVDSREALEH
jgi:molybdenum cofactor cytidylyltransferase